MPNKGATGPGKGFSTSGGSSSEDTPGWDPRTQGDRRYGKGAVLPGGKRAGVAHGAYGGVSKNAIAKRLTTSSRPKRTEDSGKASWVDKNGKRHTGPLSSMNPGKGDRRVGG